MTDTSTTALVLSGGGAKGAFQVGALQVLKEQGVTFDAISGVSVGTLNGAMLATGQFAELVTIWENLSPRQVLTEHSLLGIARRYLTYKLGFGKPPVSRFDNAPLERLMRRHLLGKSVSKPFHFGFVTLETGEYVQAVIRQTGGHTIDDMDVKRVLASTAIPVMFKPVFVNDSVWVDGGLRNISPIAQVLPYNPGRVIIIPTEPLGGEPGAEEVRDIIDIALRAINTMLDEIFREDIDRFLSVNRLVRQAEEQDAVLRKENGTSYRYFEPLVIAPEEGLGSGLNFENSNVRTMMEKGRKRALQVLGEEGNV